MSIEAKLALDVFKLDQDSHIQVDQEICRAECERKYCLYICPGKVYDLGPEGEVVVRYERCLECGTCSIACPQSIRWDYPRGGFGVQHRFG